jgi:activator of HSP90 ATPase
MKPESHTATPTRRSMLAGIAAGLGALATPRAFAQSPQPAMQQKPSNAALTTLHYEIDFKASPQRIYETLLGSKQFAAFTGMAADIDSKAGGTFSMFDGMIVGRNVELVENQRIVQAWRPASWTPGLYSIAHFEIKPRGAEASLVFDHTGFPAGYGDHLDEGWRGHYWEPMKKYFAGA